jgi:hypothetical protein
LLKKGLIVRIKNRLPKIKILGEGKLTKDIRFEGLDLSKSVRNQIPAQPEKATQLKKVLINQRSVAKKPTSKKASKTTKQKSKNIKKAKK